MNTTDQNLPDDMYWAAVPPERLAETMRARMRLFRKRLETEGRLAVWGVAERTYYGQDGQGGYANSVAVTFGGEEGERTELVVNHYRSIIQGLLAAGGQQRPSFQVRALSTDHEAMQQAPLAKGIIDGYFRSAGLEAIIQDTKRMSLVLAESFTVLRWNTSLGEKRMRKTRPVYDDNGQPMTRMVEQPEMREVETFEEDPETGEMVSTIESVVDDTLPPLLVEEPVTEEIDVRAGDVDAQTFSPLEVIRDLDSPSRALAWCIIPYLTNAWELAARFPERRRQILAQRRQRRWPTSACASNEWEMPDPGDDNVNEIYLYHLPTDAMPEGRMAIVCGDEVLFDGPMPLNEIPVYEMIPEREMRTASGYAPSFDLLALQAASNEVINVMLSQHTAVGTQNVIAPKGTEVEVSVIARGLSIVEYEPKQGAPDGGAPKPLQLLAISKDSYELAELFKRLMETLSGINSVVRGEPPANLKSGAALALVTSLATAFNSNFQGASVMHVEAVATGLIKMLQVFAETKRTATVVGRSQRSTMRDWTKESIAGIERVTVEVGNPLMDQASGKLEVANTLLNAKAITRPDQFIEVLTTGRIEPAFDGEDRVEELIIAENDDLLDGKPCTVALLEDHAKHFWAHSTCLADESVKSNPKLVANIMAHINEHAKKWRELTPDLALLSRQSVMPPPPPMPLGAPLPSASPAPDAGPPPAPVGGSKEPPAERAQPLGQPGGPNMPLMPKNPVTNERVPV